VKPRSGQAPGKKHQTGSTGKKLSFREKQELESLPEKIEILETEQQKIYTLLADPSFYKETGGAVAGAKNRMEEIDRELPLLYARWENLEDLADN
jgi:ATP-binding cassette subfamily F protein uup